MRYLECKIPLLCCTAIIYIQPTELVRLGAKTILQKEFPDAVVGLLIILLPLYLSGSSITWSVFLKGILLTGWIVGPDIVCSMDPEALRTLIDGSRIIHQARGCEEPVEAESPIAFAFASVVAIKDQILVMLAKKTYGLSDQVVEIMGGRLRLINWQEGKSSNQEWLSTSTTILLNEKIKE